MSKPPLSLESLDDRLTVVEGKVSILDNSKGSQFRMPDPVPDPWLDEPNGDPEIKYDAMGWRGKSLVGLHMSQVAADELRKYAHSRMNSSDFFTKRGGADDDRRAKFSLREARFALAWALRVEEGRGRPSPGEADGQPF